VHALEGEGLVGVYLFDEERVVVSVGIGQEDGAFLEELCVVLDFVLEAFRLANVLVGCRRVVELILALHDFFSTKAHPHLLADESW